jgi:HK97 family phage prohead protease
MATRSDTTRDVGPLAFRASVSPESLDENKRTVDVIWTTGSRVLRGYFDQFWEELSLDPKHVRMDRLNGGAPLLDAHDGSALGGVIGVVEKARLEKGRGVAKVRFARAEDDPNADAIFRKVKDGIIRNVSVGYRVHKLEKIEDAADKIPVMRATDWEPHEISFVPVGADAGAGARAESAERNPCVFVTRQETKMADEETTITPKAADPTEQLVEAAKVQQRSQKAADKAAADKAADEAQLAERKRVGEIIDACRKHGQSDDLAQKFIKAGTSIEKVRELILASLAEDDGTEINPYLRFEAGEEKGQKFVRGCVAALIERSGHTDTILKAKEVKRLAHNFRSVSLDSGEFGGMRIADMARHGLELRGRSTKGLYGDALIRHALEFRGDSGFNTTSDFAILLETAVNKIFVGQYALTPVTWPLWCGRKTVQDFRTSTFYRPGTFGVLDSVTEAGEVKHKNISDGEKRTLTPGTKGNIIGITRRALVNDDLGAFQNLAAGLGMAAAFTVEADAFALITANSGLGILYDANALFHSTRANIGPTGVMSAATLDGARAVMLKQKDPSANQFIAMRPSVWLGPAELGGIAKQFNSSTTDPTDNKAQGVTNKVLGLFPGGVVDSPYLSVQSAVRHYLIADPSLYPVFAVGFIDGNESPAITSEQSFGYDGIQMKVILDYGTAVIDYRGAVTCAGV